MGTIKLNCVYPKSKDVVWAYLTQEDLLSKWCMATSSFYLQQGKIFRFEPSLSTYWKDTFINTIIDYEVCKSFSYRFECEKKKIDTVVSWQLEEIGDKTKLYLEHSGFKFKNFFTRLYIKRGWKEMLYDNLYNILLYTGK